MSAYDNDTILNDTDHQNEKLSMFTLGDQTFCAVSGGWMDEDGCVWSDKEARRGGRNSLAKNKPDKVKRPNSTAQKQAEEARNLQEATLKLSEARAPMLSHLKNMFLQNEKDWIVGERKNIADLRMQGANINHLASCVNLFYCDDFKVITFTYFDQATKIRYHYSYECSDQEARSLAELFA